MLYLNIFSNRLLCFLINYILYIHLKCIKMVFSSAFLGINIRLIDYFERATGELGSGSSVQRTLATLGWVSALGK